MKKIKFLLIFIFLFLNSINAHANTSFDGIWSGKTSCERLNIPSSQVVDKVVIEIEDGKAITYQYKNFLEWGNIFRGTIFYKGSKKIYMLGLNSNSGRVEGEFISPEKLVLNKGTICEFTLAKNNSESENIDQTNTNQNSHLLTLLKKDYQEYKEAVFALANENEYSCFYERGVAHGSKKTNITKADYVKQTHEGPHMYFYHSNDFNYAIPQTVNPQTKKRTFAPFVLEFSGKYEKYLENTKRTITNTKDRINLKVILTNNSIQQYNFNKKNNEIRFIYENAPEFKKQNINKLDFIFQCNPIKTNNVATKVEKKDKSKEEEIRKRIEEEKKAKERYEKAIAEEKRKAKENLLSPISKPEF